MILRNVFGAPAACPVARERERENVTVNEAIFLLSRKQVHLHWKCTSDIPQGKARQG